MGLGLGAGGCCGPGEPSLSPRISYQLYRLGRVGRGGCGLLGFGTDGDGGGRGTYRWFSCTPKPSCNSRVAISDHGVPGLSSIHRCSTLLAIAVRSAEGGTSAKLIGRCQPDVIGVIIQFVNVGQQGIRRDQVLTQANADGQQTSDVQIAPCPPPL